MFVDAVGKSHPVAGADARIISLVPSITELLFALGLKNNVVGRTGFCVHPKQALRTVPKLGGTKDVDIDALFALEPTHVIVNIDENERPLYETLLGKVPHVVVTHPNAPEDNLELYRLLGGIFAREAEATRLCAEFDEALRALKATSDTCARQRVLYLIWREPWMTVSEDTYIAKTLRLVGWECVVTGVPARYPEISEPDIVAARPDLVLLSTEPYPFRAKHAAELERLCPNARVSLIDGEMISWYGNRAIKGLAYLRDFAADTMRSAA